MSEIRIDNALFVQRCQKLRERISKPLLLLLGKTADVQEFTMNSALFHYLLGYEFPETILIIQQEPVVITSPKKALILQQIPSLKAVIKNKDDSNFKEILGKLAGEYAVVDVANSKGEFCETVLSSIKYQDLSLDILEILSVKDSLEIGYMYKSAASGNYLLNKGIDLVRDMNFSKEVLENFMNDKIPGVDSDYIECSFDPEYSFEPETDMNHIRLGVRYKGYCTEIARPFLADTTTYYDVQQYALSVINIGRNSREVIDEVRKYVLRMNYPHTVSMYTVGLMEKEKDFADGFVLEKNMCYVINIDNRFSNTFIADSVSIQLTKRDRVEDYTSTRMRFRNRANDANLQQEIKEHQKMLLDQLLEERVLYHRQHTMGTVGKEPEKLKIRKYDRDNQVPRSDQVFLDWDKMYVILPIGSYSVPFHITTIKNVSITDFRLRINFKASKEITLLGGKKEQDASVSLDKPSGVEGGSGLKAEDQNGEMEQTEYDTMLKSISINTATPEELLLKINEMKKEYAKPQLATSNQEALKELTRKYALTDIYARMDSKSTNKKQQGHLEIHENGLKYNNVVILFANIRNVFFQEATPERKAILHINLLEPIEVLGRPTQNIQFFKQFTIAFHDTTKREDDRHELARMQEEEAELARTNSEFEEFIARFERASSHRVQVPECSFLGVHAKESVQISTTNSCLFAIDEQPFFVMNFEDVEVVNFERVTFMTKTFDCVFVFKDKTKQVVTVGSIERTKLSFMKELLDSNNIVFMETKVSINWSNLIQTILKDPVSFYENGGWSELLRGDDEESEAAVEEESEETTASTVNTTTTSEEGEDETSYDESEDTDVDSEPASDEDDSEDSDDESEAAPPKKQRKRR